LETEGVPQNITEINDNACKVMNASRKRKTRKTDVFPVKKVPKVFEIDKLYAIAFTNRWYSGRCIPLPVSFDHSIFEDTVPVFPVAFLFFGFLDFVNAITPLILLFFFVYP
jgi:hypothetical protein